MKCLKIILLFGCIIGLGFTNTLVAQVNQNNINDLLNKHLLISESNLSMPGYRVQIYFGLQRIKALEIKTEFSAKFPEISVYLLYQQPNFKVRAGDCKSRLEALKILDHIKNSFSVAFVVKDEVLLPF